MTSMDSQLARLSCSVNGKKNGKCDSSVLIEMDLIYLRKYYFSETYIHMLGIHNTYYTNEMLSILALTLSHHTLVYSTQWTLYFHHRTKNDGLKFPTDYLQLWHSLCIHEIKYWKWNVIRWKRASKYFSRTAKEFELDQIQYTNKRQTKEMVCIKVCFLANGN